MNYVKDNKISQRLSMLFDNTEALVNLYYTLYRKDLDEDLTVNQYDSTASLVQTKLPNLHKYVTASVKYGTASPEGTVEGVASEMYINTSNGDIWVCTSAGTTNWVLLYTDLSLIDHNVSPVAHWGTIALQNGNETVQFNTGNIKNITCGDLFSFNQGVTVRRDYVGDVSLLNTDNRLDIVNAINEIYNEYIIKNETDTYLNQGRTNSVYSGNLQDGKSQILNLNLTTKQEFVSTGVYYIEMSANESVVIELVGGGGCIAKVDGSSATYSDLQPRWRYWHSGGSGGYFKGTFTAPRSGILEVVTPIAGVTSNKTAGADAIASFISSGYETIEVARARGGNSGYPVIPALFYSEVAGGTVTYNNDYVSNIEASTTGMAGTVYLAEYIGV